MTIKQILVFYFQTHGQYAKSWRSIQSRIKNLSPLYAVSVEDLKPSMLKQYRNQRRASDATVRQEFATLKAALNAAKDDGLIDGFCDIALPEKSKEKGSYLEKAEIERLLYAADQAHEELGLFMAVGFYTGARKSAILGLNDEDFDMTANVIRFSRQQDSSNKKKVDVPVSKVLENYLFNNYTLSEGPMFSQQLKNSLNYYWNKAVALSGILVDDCTPHIMRRTLATQMAMAGKDLFQIAIILGDDVETVQRRYARFHPDYQKAAIEIDFV